MISGYILAEPITLTTLIVVNLIVAAIGVAVQLLLAKPPEGPKPAGASEFEVPTSMVGRPINHVRGKCLVTGINSLTPPFNYGYRKKKDDGNTVAIEYYFNLWVGVCRVADGVKQMRAGGKVLWPTFDDPDSEASDGTASGLVDAWDAFGTYRREGGQYGQVKFLYGDSSQTVPDSVAAAFGSDVPPARGLVSVLFDTQDREIKDRLNRGYYWGVTTYPKWPEFVVKSTDLSPDGTAIWNASKSSVGSDDDWNPAHAIYEWITDAYVGRGQDTALIGTSFSTVATTLSNEGYGISYNLDSTPDKLQDYIDKVLEIINASLVFDQNNGTYEIKLARDDYSVGSLNEYDESDFWVESFERASIGKTPSIVVVKFTERYTGDVGVAYDDDIAIAEMQGSHPIIKEFDYRAFVRSQEVADKIAAREQQTYSAMGAQIRLRCLRTMADIQHGDVFKISIASMGITTMVVRAILVEGGNLENDELTIHVMEDVYGTIYTTFAEPGNPASGPSETFLETDNVIKFSTSVVENGPY